MGGGVSKDTQVTKAQVVAAVRASFTAGKQTVAIQDLIHAVPLEPAREAPEAPSQYATTSELMHDWHHKPSVAKKGITKPIVGGGSDGVAWKAAIGSGTLTRDARMSKVRVMFDSLDRDDDNMIKKDEFVKGLAAEGVAPPEAEALFNHMDETHTGKLGIAKFEHYCACHTLAIVRDSFKQLDASHDRQVDRKEFVQYFLHNGLSKAQAANLWDAIDSNRNGKVNFVEFRDWAQDTLVETSLDEVAMSCGLSAP